MDLSPLQRWRTLPREARDTLFLLGVIAWTILPHVSHLPLWCTLLTAVMLLWRAQLAVVNGPLPTRRWLAVLLVIAAGLTLWTYRTLLGKEPGITMAVALMALKTLELRARRDAFVVFFLGFFIILTHFLYSQSLLVAAMMLVSVWGLLTALVLAHMPVGQPRLGQAGSLAARTALLGAPIMALLFVLFPRLGPLWGMPADAGPATGLSNSMRMGSVAEIAQDDRVAFRIRFTGPVPAQSAMYFRGPVLTLFDGREWRPEPARLVRSPSDVALRVRGEPIRYEMTVEPQRISVLPLLEAASRPPAIAGRHVALREDLQWVTDRPLVERVRFQAHAHTDFRHGGAAAAGALRDALWLPPGHNPRTVAWATQLRGEPRYAGAGAGELAQALLSHIRHGGYTYTLAPGVYGERSPTAAIDEFWLDRKLGFCEHFAAAFVVAMRAMEVPARIVTGYQGTDPVPVDGYYIVRQSAAHAWAEYWQPDLGWVRADPTAAVAPDRILRSAQLTPPPGLMAGTLRGVHPELLAQLRGAWEVLDNRWNQWVLSYSRGQQLDLLRRVGFVAPSWQELSLLLVITLSAIALAAAAWAWWDRRRVDPWVAQMEAVRSALQRLGVQAPVHEGPRTLAWRVRSHFGTAGDGLAELLDTLDRQRYGRMAAVRPDRSLTRRFRGAARLLKAHRTGSA